MAPQLASRRFLPFCTTFASVAVRTLAITVVGLQPSTFLRIVTVELLAVATESPTPLPLGTLVVASVDVSQRLGRCRLRRWETCWKLVIRRACIGVGGPGYFTTARAVSPLLWKNTRTPIIPLQVARAEQGTGLQFRYCTNLTVTSMSTTPVVICEACCSSAPELPVSCEFMSCRTFSLPVLVLIRGPNGTGYSRMLSCVISSGWRSPGPILRNEDGFGKLPDEFLASSSPGIWEACCSSDLVQASSGQSSCLKAGLCCLSTVDSQPNKVHQKNESYQREAATGHDRAKVIAHESRR